MDEERKQPNSMSGVWAILFNANLPELEAGSIYSNYVLKMCMVDSLTFTFTVQALAATQKLCVPRPLGLAVPELDADMGATGDGLPRGGLGM